MADPNIMVNGYLGSLGIGNKLNGLAGVHEIAKGSLGQVRLLVMGKNARAQALPRVVIGNEVDCPGDGAVSANGEIQGQV